MKKVFLMLVALSAMAFAQNPFTIVTPTIYNESGGVTQDVNAGDTLVTESYDLYINDEISFNWPGAFGDTVHANVGFQLGTNTSADTTNGFYKGGYKAFVLIDSLANNGARNGGVAIVSVNRDKVKRVLTYKLSANADSSIYNYGFVTSNQEIGAIKVRFVIVGYVGNDNTNSAVLSTARVALKRKQ